MCTTFTYVFLEMNEKDLSSTIENRIKSITKQTFFRIIWWNSMLLFFFLGKFCHSFTWTNSAREHSTKQGLHAYFGLDRINISYLNVFPGIEVSHLFVLAIYPFVCFFFTSFYLSWWSQAFMPLSLQLVFFCISEINSLSSFEVFSRFIFVKFSAVNTDEKFCLQWL